jgi:hypothetical protein
MPMPDIFSTLEQEEMWYGQDGYPYRIAEMETSHVYNVVNFLVRRAKALKERYEWRMAQFAATLGGEMAQDDADRAMRRLIDQAAEDWLENMPLMERLRRELKLRDSITPDQLHITSGPNPGVMLVKRERN